MSVLMVRQSFLPVAASWAARTWTRARSWARASLALPISAVMSVAFVVPRISLRVWWTW